MFNIPHIYFLSFLGQVARIWFKASPISPMFVFYNVFHHFRKNRVPPSSSLPYVFIFATHQYNAYVPMSVALFFIYFY
jgi:hypothetical protein